ncbi:pyrroline-5-carboxylate reductase [Vibrio gallicus]|uniref:pyrroline-5-carboxylate reductase n=1 Tax=Vibrio gallicus TaxID=190897 RepID=UPI0021C463F0|nr:pyrroline-5-carboxylate reductase [Vibrio gallicus]
MEHRTIAFIGAGNMARSIIAGLVGSGYPAQSITATAPSPDKRDALAATYGIHSSQDNLAAVAAAEVVVLSVKPQLMQQVISPFSALDLNGKLIISIAAGITVPRLTEMLATPADIIRVMPNTPSLIGLGMSGLFAPHSVPEEHKLYASQLMKAVGEVCWVEDEPQINNVIAAAGSSPAYFFLFMEAMQKEAQAQGFTEQTARLLVQQSALGAAQMVIENPELDLETLRAQVTSKGGATAQAIEVFKQQHLCDTVAESMRAAIQRAEEMESQF